MTKLTIIDNGDSSVGINPVWFEIDCPFNRNEVDEETLEWFRAEQIKIYKEFCEGSCMASYDFENDND